MRLVPDGNNAALLRGRVVPVGSGSMGGGGGQPQPTYQRVVIIGASLENAMYGKSLTVPNQWATDALANGLPVYGYATSGLRTRGLIPSVGEAIAAFPNPGETLWIIHPTGNDVTGNIEYGQRSVAELNAIRTDLNEFLDAFGLHLPHVIPILSSFRAYWGLGYTTREIFNAQEKGAKPFNDNVFAPIYAARTEAIWRYGTGVDAMCFYDWVRNDFLNILQTDGIHMTGTGSERTRAEQMRRLRLWLAGTPAAQITPAPVDNPAPVVFTPATITPSAGLVGQVFTLGPASFYGAEPMTVTGQLLLGATDVTSQIVAGQYTSTAAGTLIWRSTGSNGQGPDATSEVTATISAQASEAPIYIEFKAAARQLTGLNTVNVTPANEGVGVGPLALIDGSGGATAVTYQLSRQGGGNFTAVGINPTTWTTGTSAWNGTTIWATDIIDDVWYVPFGQVAVHTLRGLAPSTTYQFNLVGSRMGSGGRITTYAQGATSVTLNPETNPPENIGVVFTSDSNGVIAFTQDCNLGWSYISGMSLARSV